MPEIRDMLYQHGVVDKAESLRLNLERRGLDNVWLYNKVQEGWLTQEGFTQLQIIRDMCEFIYPGNWDIEVMVNTSEIKVELGSEEVTEILPIQTMGAYFGYELPEPGSRFSDDEEYYMNNYINPNTYEYYYDNRLGRRSGDFEWVTVPGPRYLSFRVVLNFPEITITNGDTNRKIYDIQFSAKFSPTGGMQLTESYPSSQVINSEVIQRRFNHVITIDDIEYTVPLAINKYILLQGLTSRRGTVTETEYSGGYLHSHSQTRSGAEGFTDWGSCCLGSSVESILATFMLLSQEFTPELFTMWLHQVQAYAEWESLEGGPHIRMSSLGRGNILQDFPPIDSNDLLEFVRRVTQHKKDNPLLPTPIDWQITPEGHYRIINNEKLSDFCKIYDRADQYPKRISFHKTINGELYEVRRTRRQFTAPSIYELEDARYLFKGEWKQLSIIEDENAIQLSDEYVIHSKVIEHIKNKLEKHASYQKIRDDIARRANQANNQHRNLPENSVPV